MRASGQPRVLVARTVRFGGTRAKPCGFTRHTGLRDRSEQRHRPSRNYPMSILIAQQRGTLLMRQSTGAGIGTI
jgi:hypothetical protein